MEYLTLYFTDKYIRITQAIADKNNNLSFREFELDMVSLEDAQLPLKLKSFLKENSIAAENVTLVIPRHKVSVRYLNLPALNRKEISRMVEYEIDNLFPYKPEELIFSETVIGTDSGGYSRVMLVAVLPEILSKYLSVLNQACLLPETVSVSSILLYDQFCESETDSDNCLLVNLEDNLLDVLVIENRKLVFSRGINLSNTEINQKIISAIKEIIDIQETKGFVVKKILASGRGQDLTKIAALLKEAFGIKADIRQDLCVSRGLDIAPIKDSIHINLLPSKIRAQKDIGKRRKSLLYLIALIALSASLITNILFLKTKEKQGYLNFLKEQIKLIETDARLLQEKLLKTQMLKDCYDSQRLAYQLLTELYRILPDGVYLTSLEMRSTAPKGVMVLIGQAPDTKVVWDFVNLIKNSSLIAKTDISDIKKRRTISGEVVDFQLHCEF